MDKKCIYGQEMSIYGPEMHFMDEKCIFMDKKKISAILYAHLIPNIDKLCADFSNT
jgi:hypothetical protein